MNEPFRPTAKIIADSISEQGHRLTTMECVVHRFVLAELNTHRVFSRNSASSRAIPISKVMERVHSAPAFPLYWGRDQAGMQSGEAFNDMEELVLVAEWENAAQSALRHADNLRQMGLHKSLVNRLLEPFAQHTVILSATEWDNFFFQRSHPAAQPEMKALADQIQIAYYTAPTPKKLSHGEWHMPYISDTDWEIVKSDANIRTPRDRVEYLKKVSTARCARVSYLTHDGKRDLAKDVEMFDQKLHLFGHWSPLEHVATPVVPHDSMDTGNFKGWMQFRKYYIDERGPTKFIPNLDELAHVRMKMEAGL